MAYVLYMVKRYLSGACPHCQAGLIMQAAHKRNRRAAGPETIQRDLAEHGIKAGICRIGKIRKNLGICCKRVKKFKVTTDSKNTLPVAGSLLRQTSAAEAPNQVRVRTSPTSLPVKAGSTVPPARISSMVRSRVIHRDRE